MTGAPTSLASARCLNHEGREAAFRCPSCHGDFCRECATEHDGRLLCTSCLRKTADKKKVKATRLRGAVLSLLFATGFLAIWLLFYFAAVLLASIPQTYHDGGLAEKIMAALGG